MVQRAPPVAFVRNRFAVRTPVVPFSTGTLTVLAISPAPNSTTVVVAV